MEGEHARITYYEQTELASRHVKLHSVSALHLKGDIVRMTVMVMPVCVTVMVR